MTTKEINRLDDQVHEAAGIWDRFFHIFIK